MSESRYHSFMKSVRFQTQPLALSESLNHSTNQFMENSDSIKNKSLLLLGEAQMIIQQSLACVILLSYNIDTAVFVISKPT